MDEVRVVRRRTYGWPIAIALIILAIVLAWAFFGWNAAETQPGIGWLVPADGAPVTAVGSSSAV